MNIDGINYISFDFISNIILFIDSNKPICNDRLYKDIVNQFDKYIINKYNVLWIKKDIVIYVIMIIEDKIMNDEYFNDSMKDYLCKYINSHKNMFI